MPTVKAMAHWMMAANMNRAGAEKDDVLCHDDVEHISRVRAENVRAKIVVRTDQVHQDAASDLEMGSATHHEPIVLGAGDSSAPAR